MHAIEEKYADFVDESVVNLSLESPHYRRQAVKRETRISLTIRHVIKSSKLKIKLYSVSLDFILGINIDLYYSKKKN